MRLRILRLGRVRLGWADLLLAGMVALGCLAAAYLPGQQPPRADARQPGDAPAKQANAAKAAPAKPPAKQPGKAAAAVPAENKPIELSKTLKKLGDNLFIDEKQKWVVMDGEVVLRRGPPLEMFACLKNTKEHESVVSVAVKALHVHAALIAVGAKQGTPVQFERVDDDGRVVSPYKPATGHEIDVRVLWTDAAGKARQARAQDWIRDTTTKKAMTHPFVFAGSMFWTDEETGERHYMAEGGELLCVSNFGSALLDLPVESSQSTAGLLFEAFTENIPPEGTKVRLVLMPKREVVKKPAAEKGTVKKEAAKEAVRKPD